MDDLLSEKEQIEQMRAWWAEYGRYVIAGVVIAVGLLFGFNKYQDNKLTQQTEASRLFEVLAGHVTDGDLDEAVTVVNELTSAYADTSYAAQSRLAMARLYMDKNRDQDAADVLQELVDADGNDELKPVARLRLARILLYQDKPQEVLDLLEGEDAKAYSSLVSEIRGDAYYALGRFAEAGDAYRTALADPAQSQSIDRALVQMKLVDLPDEVAQAAAEPVATEPEVDAAPAEAPEAAGETAEDTDAAEADDEEAGASQ